MMISFRWPSARRGRTPASSAKLTGWKIGIESAEAHAKALQEAAAKQPGGAVRRCQYKREGTVDTGSNITGSDAFL
jgi:hypothetical protein